jgi:guanylate kinase
MSKFPNIFGFSVSHTTRAPRPGEENGVHYNFVNVVDMEEAIEKGQFVEHAKVHTNFYGTSFAAIEKVSLPLSPSCLSGC